MGTVAAMVEKAASLGQPALALTDHGSVAGNIALYRECTKAGLAPFPGIEAYLVYDVNDEETRDNRWHLVLLALDRQGFVALNKLSSRSHQRDRFHRKPLIDFAEISRMHEARITKHLACLTGCYFGWIVQEHLRTDRDIDKTRRRLQQLRRWFPNLFVELQCHNVTHDDGLTDVVLNNDLLVAAAFEGIRPIVTADSHYCEPEHQQVHDLMKDICYFGDNDDNRFPGGPYDLAAADDVLGHFSRKNVEWLEEGFTALLDLHKLHLPALDNYRFRIPDIGDPDPQMTLDWKARYMLRESSRNVDEYNDRLDHELMVIEKKGMAAYFLIVADVCEWARQEGIFFEARGSANGSLVCYLLDITEVDPIQWNTSFDRFLSLDRSKPPDIDLDIESERRDDVVGYVRSRFPTMTQLGTYGHIGFTTSESDGDEDRGSVFVQYMAAMRRKDPNFNGKVHPDHRWALEELASMDVRKAPGAHASGFILPGDDLPVDEYLATMLIPSSGNTVTQAVMEDAEDCGYVKIDLLGQRSLTTIRHCVELLGRDPVDGLEWIPWDDRKTMTDLRRSRPAGGVFQFEGFTNAKGAKQLGVRNTMDAILVTALYRPAVMNSGTTERYLEARQNKKREYLHPIVDNALDDTWGVPVFQEQVIDVFRSVGMPVDVLNDLLKAIKASNDKTVTYAQGIFRKAHKVFLRCCRDSGIDTRTAGRIWRVVTDFSDYGFNRAHATAYGIRGYRSQYLKTHHPTEYMAGLLMAWSGRPKEKQYVQEAKRLGLTIARADINKSDMSWTIDTNGYLRRGLSSVHNVGTAAAEAIIDCRPEDGWSSMDDLVESVPARPVSGGKSWTKNGSLNGVLGALRDAGALKSLGVNP